MLLLRSNFKVFVYLIVNGKTLCNLSVGPEGMRKTKFSWILTSNVWENVSENQSDAVKPWLLELCQSLFSCPDSSIHQIPIPGSDCRGCSGKGFILTLTLQLCSFTNFTRICYWWVVVSDCIYFQIWTKNSGLVEPEGARWQLRYDPSCWTILFIESEKVISVPLPWNYKLGNVTQK